MRKSLTIALVLVILCASVRADVKAVKLQKPVKAVAIDSATGVVAAIYSSEDSVTVFPHLSDKGTTDGSLSHAVGARPDGVVFKRVKDHKYILVLCGVDHTLDVLDAGTLESIKRIDLPADAVALAAPIDGNCPFAYYAVGLRIGRVDLSSMTDQGLAAEQLPDYASKTLAELCPSPDGTVLYAHNGLPGGVYVLAIDSAADKPEVHQRLCFRGPTLLGIHADPFGTGFIRDMEFGEQQQPSASAWEPLANLRFKQSCFMTSRPIFFNLDDHTLHAYSYNNHRELGSKTVVEPVGAGPNALLPSGQLGRVFLPQLPMLCDEKNQKLLVIRGDRVTRFDLADFHLPNETLVNVKVSGPDSLNPGQEGVFHLTPSSPKVSVELVSPPAGMKLEGQSIRWTPGEKDIGQLTVHLRATDGTLRHEQQLAIEVKGAAIVLDFEPDELAISEDGKLAVALGNVAGWKRPFTGADKGSNMVLIDLDQTKIITKRQTPKALFRPIILGTRIFAAGAVADIVYRFSAKDIGDEDSAPQDGKIENIAGAGNQIMIQLAGGKVVTLNATTLKQSREPFMTGGFTGATFSPPLHGPQGWLYRGILYDNDFETVVCPIRPQGFPAIVFKGKDEGARWPEMAYPWGVRLDRKEVMRPPSRGALGTAPGDSPNLLNSLPALVGISEVQIADQNQMWLSLQFADLLTVTVQGQVTLASVMKDGPRVDRGRRQYVDAAGRLLVQMGHSLFVIDATKSMGKLPRPSRIVLGPLPPIPLDHSTSFTVGVEGMTEGVEFSLETNLPGESIDPATGKITIDGAALRSLAVDAAVSAMPRGSRFKDHIKTASDLVASVSKPLEESYERLSANKAGGVPVALPMRVIARGQENQMAALDFSAFLIVDPQSVAAKLVPPKWRFSEDADAAPSKSP